MKRPGNDRPTRQNEALLGNEFAASLHVRADDSLGCDVAETQIFLKSGGNNGIQSVEIEFEHKERRNRGGCHRDTDETAALRTAWISRLE